MPTPIHRPCRWPLGLLGLGVFALCGCAEVPHEPSGPTPAQRALLGMTRQGVLQCAGPPAVERAKDGEGLLVYYREASQFEESFPGTKSSFPMVRHGCRASITLREDRVTDVRYESTPPTYHDEDHCEEIFDACVSH